MSRVKKKPMKKLSKYIFIAFLLFGFAKGASAFTCTAVAGGGNWSDAATWSGCNSTTPQATDDVVIDGTSGNVTVTANTSGVNSLDMTGYTGTFTVNSGVTLTTGGTTSGTKTVIIDGGTVTWNGSLRFNPGSGNVTINLTTNGHLIGSVTWGAIVANSKVVLQDDLNFTAVKTNTFTLSATNALDLNGHTISGNSATNRVLIASATLGTQRTITRSSGTFANVDFRDIDLEASYDCSAITGLCGDAGGNSADFTFTTAATQTWTNTSGGSWSDAGNWSGRVPLPQDDVSMAAAFTTSRTVTIDMPRIGHSVDWTGATFTTALTWSASAPYSAFGSITLLGTSGFAMSGANALTLEGRSVGMPVGGWVITSNGRSFGNSVTINAPGGTYKLADAITSGSILTFTNGNFDANGMNVTFGIVAGTSNGATRTITTGAGTWTVTFTGTAWSFAIPTGITFASADFTIVVSNTAATSKTFAGGGLTYNIVTFTGSNITVTGNNTFTTLNLTNPGLIGTKFTAGTISTSTNWNISGSVGSLVSASSTSATNATWIKAGGGTVCASYISITDITASPAATFYAENSTDGGDNTNWAFTACPSGAVEPKAILNGQMFIDGQVFIQ
jgi:hypothetical protein